MFNRILKTVAVSLTVVLAGCSDSSPPEASPTGAIAATRSIVAPIPNITPTESADKPIPIPAPPAVKARGYFLMDTISGKVLAATNEGERLEPASLTKLMAAYAVFHALQSGRIKVDDQVRVSAHARDQDGSRMFIEIGTLVSVEDLIQGLIVQSGNDATVALAEHVAGSEPVFVDLMNQYALRLGMTNTHFQNSPGMPGPEHYSTARDMAILATALIREFPDYYKWYSQREFTWNKITQPNRNGLLDRDPTVDGLKTGHTESAGYCLVSSAKREDMRLVSVVMGSPSVRAREDASAALLNYGFRFYETRKLYSANDAILTLPVWKGEAEEATLAVTQDIFVTIPRGQEMRLSAAADVSNPVFAPLSRGTSIGTLRINHGDEVLGSYPLHPTAEMPEAGFIGRMVDDVKLMFE